MLETSVIITILGAFLLVLICIELLDTIKAYFYENTIHVEIVILLAIIAISRKVILLDPTGMSGIEFGVEMMGIGVIVICLAAGYFLKRQVYRLDEERLKKNNCFKRNVSIVLDFLIEKKETGSDRNPRVFEAGVEIAR
jgi:uncharacterized membrane protein (DUF373 family)